MANQTGRYTTTYDPLQRKQTVVTPVGKTITYSYDALSRKSQMQVQDAGVFTYSYDANNQLKTVQNPQNDRTTFSYDNAGRRVLKELANGTRATYLYDAAGNMTRIANLKSDNSVISQFDYQYDPVGNKIQITTASGSLTTYSYDNTYKLTAEHRTGPNPYQNNYAYDSTGNRTLTIKNGARTTSTFDPANQNVYSLDGNGRTTYSFDPSGNQTGELKPDGTRTTSTYDYENRQTLIQLPTSIRNTMAYDPDGLRVQLDDSSGTKKFVYDDQAYLLEVNGSNVITAVSTQEPTTYGGLTSQYRLNGSLWVPSYYHSDSLGNTTELTDETEAVTDTYEYNGFGEILSQTGVTTNVFQFGGLWGAFTDPDTGRVYIRARIYLPWNGRWTATDPAGFVDGMNLYLAHFVPNEVDPSGEECLRCCGVGELRRDGDPDNVKCKCCDPSPEQECKKTKEVRHTLAANKRGGNPCDAGDVLLWLNRRRTEAACVKCEGRCKNDCWGTVNIESYPVEVKALTCVATTDPPAGLLPIPSRLIRAICTCSEKTVFFII